MKYIKKGLPPESLIKHQKEAFADYDNYSKKDDLRNNLLKEQGHICCYCMQRISVAMMKIEHYKPQSIYNGKENLHNLTLSYSNLLGSCMGNQGQKEPLQHCDTYKGEKEFTKINPLLSSNENYFKFLPNGRIDSDDSEVSKDIDMVLNLNVSHLIIARKGKIDGIIQAIQEYCRNSKQLSKYFLEENIAKYQTPDKEGKLKPFCQVTIYYLQKKLKQLI